MNFKEKLKNITTFMFDVDGVLTDGSVHLLKGEIVRTLNSRDGYALQYASKLGYHILIVSGGSSQEVADRLMDLGATEVRLKSKNKIDVYEDLQAKYGFSDEQVLYMGDDIPDYPIIEKVGVGTCPQDAAVEIKHVSDYVSPKKGGQHCVRDVIEQTLRVQGKWFKEDAFQW